jgi:hypothetical protein
MLYNFGRIHETLRVTPAMEAGKADHVWPLEEIAALAVLITLEEPSAPMVKEAKAADQYRYEMMGRSYDRISIVTVRDIIEGQRRLEIPMSEVLASARLDAPEQLPIQ